jgi:hypothetical protein
VICLLLQTVGIIVSQRSGLQEARLANGTQDTFQAQVASIHTSYRCAEAAVLLFGLIRHNTTVDYPPVQQALEENLLQSLVERYGKDHVHIYLHTYEVQSPITNERNHEKNATLSKPDAGTFHPERYIIDIQEDVDTKLQMLYEQSLAVGDPYPESNGASLRNIFRAYWSLMQVWKLSELAARELKPTPWVNDQDGCYAIQDSDPSLFDVYTFARLDTVLVDKLPAQELPLKLDLLSPSWGRWGGLNDRLALTTRAGAAIYTSRLDIARDYIQMQKKLHAESALLHAVKYGNVSYGFLESQCGIIRVRASGEVSSSDNSAFCGKKSRNKICEKINKH